MRERNIQITNNRNESQIIMENKILIEFAAEYIKEKELKNDLVD